MSEHDWSWHMIVLLKTLVASSSIIGVFTLETSEFVDMLLSLLLTLALEVV